MLSYVYFGTNDLERAIAFYAATLAPLGMERSRERNSSRWHGFNAHRTRTRPSAH